MAKRKGKTKSNNRIRGLLDEINGAEYAEDIMDDLIPLLSDTQTQMPIPGKVYVYVYFASTPNLLSDRYPIVQVKGVYDWGWTGMNLHIGQQRNYNFGGNTTPLFMLMPSEVQSALTLPLMRLYQN